MNFLEKTNLYLNRYLMAVGGISVLALMALATGNVILRMFQMPYAGAYEFVSFLGAIVIASALGYTQHKRDHIIVDILSDHFPAALKNLADALSSIINIVFFAIVSWQVSVWGMQISESGELSETLKVVYHPYVYCVAAGFAVLTLTCTVEFLATLRRLAIPALHPDCQFSERPEEERT